MAGTLRFSASLSTNPSRPSAFQGREELSEGASFPLIPNNPPFTVHFLQFDACPFPLPVRPPKLKRKDGRAVRASRPPALPPTFALPPTCPTRLF